MNTGNIAFLDETAGFHVHENRGDYDADTDAHDAATDHAKPLHEAQYLVGDALNLAGLLLAALEYQGDARAMQASTAVTVIEDKRKAANRAEGSAGRTRHYSEAGFCRVRDRVRTGRRHSRSADDVTLGRPADPGSARLRHGGALHSQ